MKIKKKFIIVGAVFLATLIVSGTAFAATEWSGDNTFTGTVNWFKKGVKIGQQGSGGVTFFNGTIVNQTTTDGADNPVAFGDNVRIDGEIWRGASSGTSDDTPVKINDKLTTYGTSTFKDTVTFENGASGLDYAASSHSHDDTYYTETEVDSRLSSKADTSALDSYVSKTDEITDNFNISCAAFTPLTLGGVSGYEGQCTGVVLSNLDGDSDWWYAPVDLPSNAVVNSLTFYYKDSSGVDATADLQAYTKADGSTYIDMASVASSGSTGNLESATDSSIVSATVDNSSYIYFLKLQLPVNTTEFYGATVNYSVARQYD